VEIKLNFKKLEKHMLSFWSEPPPSRED